jgi:hypothetical protein
MEQAANRNAEVILEPSLTQFPKERHTSRWHRAAGISAPTPQRPTPIASVAEAALA